MTDSATRKKEESLVAWLAHRGRVAIGFSGGVDSSYLAAVTLETLGSRDTLAIIGRSESLARSEEDHAVTVAKQVGIPMLEVSTGELSDPQYAANPANRCYFCKNTLWRTLRPPALSRGFETLVDGTNADDLGDYRPGARAAKEQGIESPLADLGLTKAEIRTLTRARGWPWWDRPSSPCLASRLPYGMAVTRERLGQVERAESALRGLGILGNLRVRHHGALARIELDRALVSQWSAGQPFELLRESVESAGFERVEIDPRGYQSGSLNVLDGGAPLSGH